MDESNYTLLTVPHDKVSKYLMAADIGFSLREKSVVDRVASPVKFAEYLRCGVGAACTDNIEDISSLVSKDSKSGILITKIRDETEIFQNSMILSS